jgi:hypothetical protein
MKPSLKERFSGLLRFRILAPGALLVLASVVIVFSVGCSCRPWYRDNALVRKMFYPPAFVPNAYLGEDTEGATFDHSILTELSQEVVDEDGMVNYDLLYAKRDRLDEYLMQLAEVDLPTLTRYEQMALLLNAYNAFTWRLILDYPGIASIRDIPADERWTASRWNLGGETMSLDHLEHGIIRKEYADFRIHFAVNCASIGCAILPQAAFTGEQLIEQLDHQTRIFLAEERNFRWDPESETIHLSELIDWFMDDFAKTAHGAAEVLIPYYPAANMKSIMRTEGDFDVCFLKYDWNLNGQWTLQPEQQPTSQPATK